MHLCLRLLCVGSLVGACGSSPGARDAVDGSISEDAGSDVSDASQDGVDAAPASAPKYAELWYSVDDQLIYIELNPADGSVVQILASSMGSNTVLGQNGLTMLDDGSLIGERLSSDDDKTYFYHVAEPKRDGSPVTVTDLGVMPDDIMLEGLYTDCDGRMYGMDTGVNNSSSEGNRLLRFTGNYLAGDFSYEVVSDLASADVADIDDMGPGIVDGKISDNPGLAIDTSNVYTFDYQTGTGSLAGSGGTFGIHALGDSLFGDGKSRLYVLSNDAELFEMDPVTYSLSGVLATGPTNVAGTPGWSGLAGSLTDCDSGFVID